MVLRGPGVSGKPDELGGSGLEFCIFGSMVLGAEISVPVVRLERIAMATSDLGKFQEHPELVTTRSYKVGNVIRLDTPLPFYTHCVATTHLTYNVLPEMIFHINDTSTTQPSTTHVVVQHSLGRVTCTAESMLSLID